METLIQVVNGVLTLIMLAGWLVLVVAGFRRHVLWGIGNLLLTPIVPLVFAVKYWSEARLGCLLQLIPFIITMALLAVFWQVLVGAVAVGVMQTEQELQAETRAQTGGSGGADTGSGATGQPAASASEPEPAPVVASTPAPAPPARPRFEYREVNIDLLPTMLGKQIKVDLNDGRERVGILRSVDRQSLKVEMRSRGGSMEFRVRRDTIARLRVLDQVQ